MNTVRTSNGKSRNLVSQGFLNSIFYTFPVGMFLTACNCMFESVRDYYFDWWIVALPTISVWLLGYLYEMFWLYDTSYLFSKREKPFGSKDKEYVTSNTNLATS